MANRTQGQAQLNLGVRYGSGVPNRQYLNEYSDIKCKLEECPVHLTKRQVANGALFHDPNCKSIWHHRNEKNKPIEKLKSRYLKFKSYYANNPIVYEELKRLALLALEKKLGYFSVRDAFGYLRCKALYSDDPALAILSDDEFKLNNILTPYYARKLIQDIPELKGYIRLRKLGAENIDL